VLPGNFRESGKPPAQSIPRLFAPEIGKEQNDYVWDADFRTDLRRAGYRHRGDLGLWGCPELPAPS
jgi:hypothetical protein